MIHKIIIGILIIASFYLFIFWFERKNLYFPLRRIEATPDDIGLIYEDVYFDAEDGQKLHGWYIPANSKKVLILLHGNGGNICHRLELISIFHGIGLNVFIFDYRGYGNSQGIATEKGTILDGIAAYNYVRKLGTDPECIILLGRSLGANIAIELATMLEAGILISEGGFTSVMNIAKDLYRIRPPGFLIHNKYNALGKISKVNIPTLIIHGQDDEIIPIMHGLILYEEANEPKEFFKIKGGHNDGFILTGEEYYNRIKEFINEYSKCN
jgi:hypothetical protein